MEFFHASGDRPIDGYTIKRGIGTGGFGEVYFAISDAGKEVALKRVQRHLDVEMRGVRQCLNLRHPNLLALYDIRQDDKGHTWVIMEYMGDSNLQSIMEQHPHGLPHEEVKRWLNGIAQGLDALHDHGIVHRDLKPANIFMDSGFVKIGDYGLSKFISCSRRSGHTESVGTFHYMAPEIGLGSYGKEIDVYALGILLYEMLTGHVPFDGESSQEIIMKHLTAQPDLSILPPDYVAVVGRCLAKDPQHRPRTVSELMKDLPGKDSGANSTSTSATEPVLTAEVVTEPHRDEPLWHAARQLATEIRWRWNQAELPLALRLALVVITIVGGIMLTLELIPLLLGGWLLYLGYYVVWRMATVPGKAPCVARPSRSQRHNPNCARAPSIQTSREEPKYSAVSADIRAVGYSATQSKPSSRPVDWRILARQDILDHKSWLNSATQLFRSWCLAAFVTAISSLLSFLVATSANTNSQTIVPGTTYAGPTYAWIYFTTLLSSWCLLAVSQSYHGHEIDPALKRFRQLVVGLLVGAFAYLLSEWLYYQPTYLVPIPRGLRHGLTDKLYDVQGFPTAYAFLGYFAGLFGLARWWRFSDPMRAHRMAWWPTFSVGVLAAAWNVILPMPLGVLVATSIAFTVQLSAPWINELDRHMVRERAQQSPDIPINVSLKA